MKGQTLFKTPTGEMYYELIFISETNTEYFLC